MLQEMQEAVSNVYILNQNIEHLNDVVREQVPAYSSGSEAHCTSFADAGTGSRGGGHFIRVGGLSTSDSGVF